jgi:hypothetical protein
MKISFQHNYPKLHNQTKAELLAIKCLDAKDVQKNKDLLEYDTRYKSDMIGLYEYYPLSKTGQLIQLIFLGDKGIPFCTIRTRFGYDRGKNCKTDKLEYYQSKIGEWFEVIKKL